MPIDTNNGSVLNKEDMMEKISEDNILYFFPY
jgi:hypothetical protein